jgi:hypothetical protein
VSRLLTILALAVLVQQGGQLAAAAAEDDCAGECPDDGEDGNCPPDCHDCVCCAIPRVTTPDAVPSVGRPEGGALSPLDVPRVPVSGDPAEVFHVPKPLI